MPPIIDAHLHCSGREDSASVLRALDEAGIERGVLLAPFLSPGYDLGDAASLRRANAHLARLIRGHEDRLTGLAVVDPRDDHAEHDLRHAVQGLGLHGVKLVPTGWYPFDERARGVYALASSLGLPMLFHSGIFIDGRSGRFCRPVYLEVLREHPGTRVALAHMGWPWTDEALAVALIDRIHQVPPERAQFRLDISFGAPPPYREALLSRMVQVLGPQCLQYGSDCFLPCSGAHLRERLAVVKHLMEVLELDDAARHAMLWGTAAAWLGLPDARGARPATDGDDAGGRPPPSDPPAPARATVPDAGRPPRAGASMGGSVAGTEGMPDPSAGLAARLRLPGGGLRWPGCC